MKRTKAGFLGLSLIVMMTAATPLASAQAAHVRWDIQNVVFGPSTNCPSTVCFNPGGSATAIASDGSTITMTGSGTFTSPASGGSTGSVTGGGTWRVVPASGPITSGTYVVTELVSWLKSNPIAPAFCFPCGGSLLSSRSSLPGQGSLLSSCTPLPRLRRLLSRGHFIGHVPRISKKSIIREQSAATSTIQYPDHSA